MYSTLINNPLGIYNSINTSGRSAARLDALARRHIVVRVLLDALRRQQTLLRGNVHPHFAILVHALHQ